MGYSRAYSILREGYSVFLEGGISVDRYSKVPIPIDEVTVVISEEYAQYLRKKQYLGRFLYVPRAVTGKLSEIMLFRQATLEGIVITPKYP